MSDRTVSLAEVRRHSTGEDSWIVLNGVVWDFSNFAAAHPGGPEVIESHFGQDGSEVYNELHSPTLVEKYFGPQKRIGLLVDDGVKLNIPEDTKIESEAGKPDLETIISIREFDLIASKALRPKAYAYISGATENGITKDANSDWYRRIWFRPRVLLTGVGTVDLSTTILGQKYASPIFNAPTASVMLAHKDGELAWARGLSACGNTLIIPTMSSYPVEEIVAVLPKNHPFFFQLYVHSERAELELLLDKIGRLRPQAIIVTVDLPVMTKREGYMRYLIRERVKNPIPTTKKVAPMLSITAAVDPELTWKNITWIRERTGLPVFVKGVQSAADARLAFEGGCAGIYISNHGGRALDTALPSIATLLEIRANCPEILDKMEVFIDGGIQRGTDILKALCLGASAVCLGRPFLYALAYGEEGVKHAVQSEFTRSRRVSVITADC
jgi:L-lactate dehydrogenase (cytochrome)